MGTARKKKQRIDALHIIIYIFAVIGVISTVAATFKGIHTLVSYKKIVTEAPEITEDYLTVNEYSRPGTAISEIHGIVVHYTANPGTSAKNNRDYFEGLKDSGATYASSHYIIGLDGEIIMCIPLSEKAYASNDRNSDTIAIECCHSDESGKFSDETYDSLVHLVAWLVGEYDLEVEDVIRHYDVSGKMCPKYYVENPGKWDHFLSDVLEYIDVHGKKVYGD